MAETVSIGPNGWVDLLTAKEGAKRKPVRVVSFVGLAAAGPAVAPGRDAGQHPVAVIDVTDGKLRTSEFSDTGNNAGFLTQLDTGPSGHTILAIMTDTGV